MTALAAVVLKFLAYALAAVAGLAVLLFFVAVAVACGVAVSGEDEGFND